MNTRRKKFLEQLADYFIKNGGVMTEQEYKARRDVPIRPFFVKRYIGNWAKVLKLMEKSFPEVYEVTKPEPAEKKPEVKKTMTGTDSAPANKPAVKKPAVKEVKDEK